MHILLVLSPYGDLLSSQYLYEMYRDQGTWWNKLHAPYCNLNQPASARLCTWVTGTCQGTNSTEWVSIHTPLRRQRRAWHLYIQDPTWPLSMALGGWQQQDMQPLHVITDI